MKKRPVRVGDAGHPDDALEDGVEVAVAAGPRADEDEAADQVGPRQGQLLRDRAAHGEPRDVRPPDAEVVEQRRRVGGHVGHAEAAGRQRRLADAAVVDDGDAVAVAERADLGVPRRVVVAEPAQQQQVVAGTGLFVVEVDASELHVRHPPSVLSAGCARRERMGHVAHAGLAARDGEQLLGARAWPPRPCRPRADRRDEPRAAEASPRPAGPASAGPPPGGRRRRRPRVGVEGRADAEHEPVARPACNVAGGRNAHTARFFVNCRKPRVTRMRITRSGRHVSGSELISGRPHQLGGWRRRASPTCRRRRRGARGWWPSAARRPPGARRRRGARGGRTWAQIGRRSASPPRRPQALPRRGGASETKTPTRARRAHLLDPAGEGERAQTWATPRPTEHLLGGARPAEAAPPRLRARRRRPRRLLAPRSSAARRRAARDRPGAARRWAHRPPGSPARRRRRWPSSPRPASRASASGLARRAQRTARGRRRGRDLRRRLAGDAPVPACWSRTPAAALRRAEARCRGTR